MNFPSEGDYIDIHNHGGVSSPGIFCVENLMAHENRMPENLKGMTYSYGIHPWHLNEENLQELIKQVERVSDHTNIFAVGEAGFDRLKGPDKEIQIKAFRAQAEIAERIRKPLFIHCVKGWDELVEEHRRAKPENPWTVHGFRGSAQLANQIIRRGFYLSLWFSFAMDPASDEVLKAIPDDRIFLETDGSGEDIASIYSRVATGKGMKVKELQIQIYKNFFALAGS
jgi:TatD DNase family protein